MRAVPIRYGISHLPECALMEHTLFSTMQFSASQFDYWSHLCLSPYMKEVPPDGGLREDSVLNLWETNLVTHLYSYI